MQKTKINVAVISGGFGYLGVAIAKRLLSDGYRVVCLRNSTSDERAKTVLATFLSPDIHEFKVDLRDEVALCDVLNEIEEKIGQIDVGVHAAQGKILRKKISEIRLSTLKEQISTPVFGGYNFFSGLATHMRPRKRGVLIGITSSVIEGITNVPRGNFGGYITTKLALLGLLLEFAHALQGDGIRVHTVAPGFLPGGLNSDLPDRFFELLSEGSLNKVLTTPEDVASVVSEICSGNITSFTSIIDRLSAR